MEELAVKDLALAPVLLGAEHVLVAALGLGVRVGRALGVAGLPVVHVHLVLYVALHIT